MPRLSLYKPERGQDYKFIDRQISEMFQVGGTDVYLHKYMGPKSPSDAEATIEQPQYKDDNGDDLYNVANIQDLLFLENRDRKYDEEIYRIRGLYNVQNIDFNLSQFGLFIDNDTLFMTVHINDFIKYIGRKPISGDVIELPHLRDDFALNDFDVSLPRYYVIEDVGRASEGFSATWYPHLYRLKLRKITDNQQFADILDKPATLSDGTESDKTLREILSTHNKELQINDAIIGQAELDTPQSGYETQHFYTLAVDEQGRTMLQTADQATLDASAGGLNVTAASMNSVPDRSGYSGYLLGDGIPNNGAAFGHGIQFPSVPAVDDYFLRTDFLPNRLFKFDGTRWIKIEDNIRMSLSNYSYNQGITTPRGLYSDATAYAVNDLVDYGGLQYIAAVASTGVLPNSDTTKWKLIRNTQRMGFINNTNVNTIGGEQVPERQSLSKALKPQADL